MNNTAAKSSAILGGGLLSLCCGVPLALALLGIGGTAFGGLIGAYHWYFTGAGVFAVLLGWFLYYRETQKACDDGSCEAPSRSTRTLLIIMSFVMAGFVGLSAYTNFKAPSTIARNQAQGRLIKIGVEGMTCASCEAHIEHAVKQLPGVFQVDASTPAQSVSVDYDPARCNAEMIEKAIEKSGYKTKGVLQG